MSNDVGLKVKKFDSNITDNKIKYVSVPLLYIISNSIVLPFINKRRRKNQKICLNIYFYSKL